MKKKILTLTIAAALSMSLFAGCGKTAVDADNNSVADSGTEKTGETEGAAKQSYFEEHGAQVADGPVACTVDAVLFDYFETDKQRITDIVWEQLDCYSEPASEEGYQIIHLELGTSQQFYYDAAQFREYSFCYYDDAIYDWYTGRVFPARDLFLDDGFDYSTTVEVDGIPYDVSYSKNVSYEYGNWVYDSNGNGTKNGSGRSVYTFKVPDGYDGLVFAALPKHKYTGQDTENMDESERYAFDDEFAKDTTFFRINKEGMVPERKQ